MTSLRIRAASAALLIAAPFAATAPFAAAVADSREAAVGRITRDISYLASDELEGRGVETAGNGKAAEYVRAAFEAAGLKGGMPDGSYLQPFTISLGDELIAEKTHLSLGVGEPTPLELGKDFEPLSLGEAGGAKAPVVFAGYGISAPDLKYDDYAGADVKGKVVLVLRKEPRQDDPHSVFEGTETTAHSFIRTKLKAAADRGAAAVLIVNDSGTAKAEAGKDELVKPSAFGDGAIKVPFGQITRAAADRLLAASPVKVGDESLGSLAAVEAKIDATMTPVTQELAGVTADLAFAFTSKEVVVPNVVGVLPGEGPQADEAVVIGAHLDHIGYGETGSRKPNVHEIHNGADDNASGTAALLELVRRLTAGPKPPRTVVFVAFNGEERGLLGSAYYVEHPVWPLDRTVFMLNFDMVGRLGEHPLTVYGVGSAKGLDKLVASASEDRGFKVEPVQGVIGDSDDYSFYLKKVPVFHLFTGLTKEYHTPDDDVATLNLSGVGQSVDFAADVVASLLADPRPEYMDAPRESRGRGGNMAYFGVVPDYSGGADGLKVNGVGEGSPAEKGGLKAGDVITKFGDIPVGDIQGLADGLRKYKPHDRVKVVVRRGETEETVEVELGEPRKSAK